MKQRILQQILQRILGRILGRILRSKIILLIFIPFLLPLLLLSCQKETEVRSITPLETLGEMNNGFALLVDVREASELEQSGLASGAKWVPLSSIQENTPEWKNFVERLPKDKNLVFYCAAGGRAGQVAQKLSALGYRTSNMGGFRNWKDAGLPVQKFHPKTQEGL